jgi:hypothetical protein
MEKAASDACGTSTNTKKQSSSRSGRRKRLRDIKDDEFYQPGDNSVARKSARSTEAAPAEGAILDLLPRKSASLVEQEADFVCRQLGYVPYNLVEVAATRVNSNGVTVPLTLKLYPLNRKERKPLSAASMARSDGTAAVASSSAATTSTTADADVDPSAEVVPTSSSGSSSSSNSSSSSTSKASKSGQYYPFPTMMWLSCPETYAKISKVREGEVAGSLCRSF